MAWSDYDQNPYSNPGNVGLEIIASMDDQNAFYTFDMVIVWKELSTGKLYVGLDSGCSCPSPFEDVRGLEDLYQINTVDDLKRLVEVAESEYGEKWPHSDRVEMYRKVRKALADAS